PYEGGPNATTFLFTAEGAALEGSVEQLTTPDTHFDTTFGMQIGPFAGKARFAQRVRLTAATATVAVDIEWMICDDQTCMPPEDIRLTLTVPEGSEGAAPAAGAAEAETPQAGAAQNAAAEQPAVAPAATKDAAGSGSLWA
ncbi:protein-disulfide reductase DsbD domain-containing protein, partial [Clostridium cuniculi]|uniref:protein-disulfide reductase DsbD domain-containing protein n=1 Tax=Clostridium cuniculi TaxID=2548455 RepID=UPI0023B9A4E2